MPTKYYLLLEDFLELNGRLISKGQSYLSVVLCHELYRFLYPTDPYANFINSNPVEFSINHLKRLIEVGNSLAETVVPYNINLSEFSTKYCGDLPLEKATSDLYSDLWQDFDLATLTEESVKLLRARLPQGVIEDHIVGKEVLDMGCGSGRYSIALAKIGAKKVVGADVQAKSFAPARQWCKENNLDVEFREANILELPFEADSFDFIFCNGVLHHTNSIRWGLEELARVLKARGRAFLYIYGAGGIFWTTRQALRQVFTKIPVHYTKMVLRFMGMPSNRFIFCDTWYVPVETHTTTHQLISMLKETGFSYQKVIGNSPFDLDKALASNIAGAKEMWGDAEHRYILVKIK